MTTIICFNVTQPIVLEIYCSLKLFNITICRPRNLKLFEVVQHDNRLKLHNTISVSSLLRAILWEFPQGTYYPSLKQNTNKTLNCLQRHNTKDYWNIYILNLNELQFLYAMNRYSKHNLFPSLTEAWSKSILYRNIKILFLVLHRVIMVTNSQILTQYEWSLVKMDFVHQNHLGVPLFIYEVSNMSNFPTRYTNK